MKDPLIVIALCGVARSGKDSVARFLAAEHGFQRLALADGIRQAFAGINEPTWDALKELHAAGKSARWALQVFGTEARREVECPDHWIDHLAVTIQYFSRHHPVPKRRWVVPDLRYPAEAIRLRELVDRMDGKFEVWKVERPGVDPIAEASHSSETSVSQVLADRTIVNDGALLALGTQAGVLAEMALYEANGGVIG